MKFVAVTPAARAVGVQGPNYPTALPFSASNSDYLPTSYKIPAVLEQPFGMGLGSTPYALASYVHAGAERFQNPDLSQDLLSPAWLLLPLPLACQPHPCCRTGTAPGWARCLLPALQTPPSSDHRGHPDPEHPYNGTWAGHCLQPPAESVLSQQTRRETLTWVQNLSGGSPQVIPAGSTRTVT